MKRSLLCLLLIIPCSLLIAFDFGLVFDQSIGVGGTGSDNDFDYDVATPNGGVTDRAWRVELSYFFALAHTELTKDTERERKFSTE